MENKSKKSESCDLPPLMLILLSHSPVNKDLAALQRRQQGHLAKDTRYLHGAFQKKENL